MTACMGIVCGYKYMISWIVNILYVIRPIDFFYAKGTHRPERPRGGGMVGVVKIIISLIRYENYKRFIHRLYRRVCADNPALRAVGVRRYAEQNGYWRDEARRGCPCGGPVRMLPVLNLTG